MNPLRLAAWVCAVLHVSAFALPCPIAPLATSHTAQHAMGHGQAVAHDAHAACTPALRLEAPCPCGCEEPGVASTSARLGWAELCELRGAGLALAWTPLIVTDARLPEAPGRGIDPIPI